MPAVFQKTVEQDLHKPLKIQYCADAVFTKDNTGNLINVLLFEDGVPYNGGGTVSATAIRADGATESWAGTISGNTVSVALTRAALDVPGTLQVFIKVTAGTVETTVYAGVYNVVCTETPTVVAPVTPSDVAALIASIEAAIRNIPADWTSFLGTIAPTFDPAKADGYAAGDYVWYPGQTDNVGTLYRFTSAHSGTWTGTDAVTVVIGNELNDTVRYTQQVHTDAEKTVARANIGAASNDGLYSLGYQVSVNTTDIDVIQRTIGSGLDPNNTVKSQLDGIKADIGTVPTGETVEGQITDLKSAIDVLEPVATSEDVGKALIAKTVTNGKVSEYEFGNAGEGLTEDAKIALLACFQHVAWTDDKGQTYYDALYDSLFPDVVAITATFTPGSHVFYDTDSLNALRPYLVVTATTYEGETKIVSNYSLSGSMSAGTNTITVRYQNLTDTFTVTVLTHIIFAAPQGQVFDGTQGPIDTGIKLMAQDRTFTLLLDATENVDYTPSAKVAQGSIVNNGFTIAVYKVTNASNVNCDVSLMKGKYTTRQSTDVAGHRRIIIAVSHTVGMIGYNIAVSYNGVIVSPYSDTRSNYAFSPLDSNLVYASSLSGAEPFKGTINEFVIYDYAYTQSELEAYATRTD